MQDNQNNAPRNEDKGGPKFNYFWIYGVIALILIGLNFFWPSSTVKSIDRNKLEKIIRANDLEKIVIINKEKAEIYIKKDSTEKADYKKDIPKPSMALPSAGPHFTHNIGNDEVFENRIYQLQDEIRKEEGKENFNITITNERRVDWVGGILSWVLHAQSRWRSRPWFSDIQYWQV